MRVLLTSQPGYGHFRPLLPLANALVAAGHEVRVGTSASFAQVVEREGLTAEPVGLDWLHGVDESIPPELRPPREADTLAKFFAYKFVRMTAERLATDVVAMAGRWRPDVVERRVHRHRADLARRAIDEIFVDAPHRFARFAVRQRRQDPRLDDLHADEVIRADGFRYFGRLLM